MRRRRDGWGQGLGTGWDEGQGLKPLPWEKGDITEGSTWGCGEAGRGAWCPADTRSV